MIRPPAIALLFYYCFGSSGFRKLWHRNSRGTQPVGRHVCSRHRFISVVLPVLSSP